MKEGRDPRPADKELRKTGCSDAKIAEALSSTSAQAGFSIEQLDALAGVSIDFETKKSAALSFAAGLPGGFAMLATIPGDVTQYYVHAFRIMQKLSYLYGWQDFLGDLEAPDDETVAHLAVFLGVMMGVGGASLQKNVTLDTKISGPAGKCPEWRFYSFWGGFWGVRAGCVVPWSGSQLRRIGASEGCPRGSLGPSRQEASKSMA